MIRNVALLALGALLLAGCGNETNAPSLEEVKQADQKRIETIDNDPRLSAQQKEMMKSHLSGGKAQGR